MSVIRPNGRKKNRRAQDRINVSGLTEEQIDEIRALAEQKKKEQPVQQAGTTGAGPPTQKVVGATTSTTEPQPMEEEAARPSEGPAQEKQRNPPNPRVVIFENYLGMTRKQLEPELVRVAPWLRATAVDIMRSGGLRVKCQTPADADRLLKREGFPTDAFGGDFTVHRPGSTDPSKTLSARLEKELRSIVTARLPGCYTADELRTLLHPDYVEEIRDIPPKDHLRPPLRVIVLKTKAQRDDAISNGLQWMNRRVKARPLRSPVLPVMCRRCCNFGHAVIDCKSETPVCAKCASKDHMTQQCTATRERAVCPNCPIGTNTNHFAYWRGCPAFKRATALETELRRVRAEKKKQKQEEREERKKQFSTRDATVQPGRTFAAATTTLESTQTAQPTAQGGTVASDTAQFTSLDCDRLYKLLQAAIERSRNELYTKLGSLERRIISLEHDVTDLQFNDNANDQDTTMNYGSS